MTKQLNIGCQVQHTKDNSLFGKVTSIAYFRYQRTEYFVLWDGYDTPVLELASSLNLIETDADVLYSHPVQPTYTFCSNHETLENMHNDCT